MVQKTLAPQIMAPKKSANGTFVELAMAGLTTLFTTEPMREMARLRPIARAISLPRNQS